MSDAVTIIIRADNGQAVRAFRDTEGRLRDMRGRFVSEGSVMSGAMRRVASSIGSLIPVATAAVPVTAALGAAAVKTAGSAAGAGLAVAAFGAAVAGQVSSLSDASKAQEKYNESVTQYGRGSKQAARRLWGRCLWCWRSGRGTAAGTRSSWCRSCSGRRVVTGRWTPC